MGNGPTEDVLTGLCANCGQQVQPEAVYCTSCGVPVLPPPKRRPLFVDEIDDAPAAAPPPTEPRPIWEPEPTDVRPPFFANAEVDPPRPRRRGPMPIVLALLFVVVAGAIGWTLGKDDKQPTPSAGTPPISTKSSPSSSTSAGTGVDPSTPQEQLLRIARIDTRSASHLVGDWVPQLAAVSAGVGGDSGWKDALTHYEQLKSDYPDVLLLDTGEWPSSYVKSGMYAIVVPLPSHDSQPVLKWCVAHSLSKNDCAAKHLDTSGDPNDNYDAQ